MIVEGRTALDEYLKLILPGIVLRPIFGSKIYEYFVAGAPGLKELMCVGKIFYEVERTENGQRVWDIVIVDAPATGHGLEYFRMPQSAHDTFAVGLVHRETERVLRLMRDPALCLHLLVTLAQELPVSETLQLHRAIAEDLRFPVGPIIVNRCQPEALPEPLEPDFEAFRAAASERLALGSLLVEILHKTQIFQTEHQENLRQIERLRSALGLPVVVLPALFEAELSPSALEPLLRRLDEQTSRVDVGVS
jgi:anion-transporting  ArsA/GET3 family ATPase